MHNTRMTSLPQRPDVIAIGASAGGVEALSELLSELPPALPASVLVVLHRPVERESHLREILSRVSNLPVVIPREGELMEHGVCYIGEPNRHLTVGTDMRLHFLVNGFYRGHNIDALFCSLSRNAGKRTIGIILSG